MKLTVIYSTEQGWLRQTNSGIEPTDEWGAFVHLMNEGFDPIRAREQMKTLQGYSNVEVLQVFHLPFERTRKWFLCDANGVGRRVRKEYARMELIDAGHSARAADLILRAALRDPITTNDLLHV